MSACGGYRAVPWAGQRPTLIDNVETLAHLALIARFGPAWFRRAGTPDSPGTMLTTVAGAVAEPGVYEIEAGTRIGDVLAISGLRPDAGHVLIGGYFGTWHDIAEVASLPFTSSGLRSAGASPGAGVLFALPSRACGLTETARVLNWLAGQGAGQCGPCAFGLPAIASDFAQIATGQIKGPVLERVERRLGTVDGRGACRHPDGAIRLARAALTHLPPGTSAIIWPDLAGLPFYDADLDRQGAPGAVRRGVPARRAGGRGAGGGPGPGPGSPA